MNLITDERLKKSGFAAGTVLRQCGNMAERINQDTFFRSQNIPSDKMVRFRQVHGNTIIPVNGAKEADALIQAPFADADGWICTGNGFGVIIMTADCVPLFVWNADGSHFALAHCGWRGVAKQLPFKTIQALLKNGAKPPFFAWAGPHIQPCCFEVQEDTASQFSNENVLKRDGKLFVHLNNEIRGQLRTAGLAEEDIILSDRCTCCEEKDFFSWRRDHVRNLLLSFIYRS